MRHLYLPGTEYFLVGDERVVTKSGKETHGLNYFFSGLINKVVKRIAIFSLSLVSVEERRPYPLRVEQVIRSEAEKEVAKERRQKQTQKDKAATRKKRGCPKGSGESIIQHDRVAVESLGAGDGLNRIAASVTHP